MKVIYFFLLAIFSIFASGCASVEMASTAESDNAKLFAPPPPGKSGIYIYRNSFVGKALKKNIWIDGQCLGESAPDVFFYTQVEGGKKHTIETESEFSPNALELMFEAGKNYFVRQYIKLGVFIGGANLENVPEEKGREDIKALQMARITYCNRSSHVNSTSGPPSTPANTLTVAPAAMPLPVHVALPHQQLSTPIGENVSPPGPTRVAPESVEAGNTGTRPDLYFQRPGAGATGKLR